MFEKTEEEQIRELDKEFAKVAAYETPGFIMLALGLYGKFGANGEAFHPLLNDTSVINSLLMLGAIIMILSALKVINIVKKKKALLGRTDI